MQSPPGTPGDSPMGLISLKASKILLFKLRLHHCHLSVSTPSSAPSCCLPALSLLLTSATLPCPTPLLPPPWISCSQGWSQASQSWWILSAQDLPAADLESLWGWRSLPPRRASADWSSAGTEAGHVSPRASGDPQHCPLQPRHAAPAACVQIPMSVHGGDLPAPNSTFGLQWARGCCCSQANEHSLSAGPISLRRLVG